jgi:hypothetical protein
MTITTIDHQPYGLVTPPMMVVALRATDESTCTPDLVEVDPRFGK